MLTADRDPFSNTADPAAYIPRTATEFALVQLEMALHDGCGVLCLEGPAGSGKTLLLHVLEERLAGDFSTLRVPYPMLDPDEFCRWALDALGGDLSAPDPGSALAVRIDRLASSGKPLIWMIDDADSMPASTLRRLLQLQRSAGDALRLLLTRSGELVIDELAQAGVAPEIVELEGEMDRSEMAQYVRARLDRSGAPPDEREQIESALDRLYARSHGNPGQLHAAAAVLLCFGFDRLCALPADGPAESPVQGDVAAAVPDERVSIESLVAEAVAAEQPAEEITAALDFSPDPESEPDPQPDPQPARAPKRIRLRGGSAGANRQRNPHCRALVCSRRSLDSSLSLCCCRAAFAPSIRGTAPCSGRCSAAHRKRSMARVCT